MPGPTRAWDARRPPAPELIDDCVHCGFCLPTCPTYALWGEEMDSPRGRIALMQFGHEQPELSDEMVTHFDRCLGCMACVTACPSGVRYDLLIQETRPQVERLYARSLPDRLFRRLIFAVFPHPDRLRALVPIMRLHRRLGLGRLVPKRFRRLRAMLALAPEMPRGLGRLDLPERTPARAPARGRVGLMQGCVQRVLFAGANVATQQVLSAEGWEVYAPPRPRCCGSLQQHTGYESEAQALARETIAAFEHCDVVVVNAAGCGSGMKGYDHLLAEDPAWAERAQKFVGKVRDVHELLAEHEPRSTRHAVPLRIAYHDPCHLAHAQGIRDEPRALLRDVPELVLLEPAEWELCCGSAGIYNLVEPDAAADLAARKVHNLLATGAEAIAVANPGCALQIDAELRRRGHQLRIWHPVELLSRSLRGRPG
jgi:glycolate oxidase iron-sulfur subunit